MSRHEQREGRWLQSGNLSCAAGETQESCPLNNAVLWMGPARQLDGPFSPNTSFRSLTRHSLPERQVVPLESQTEHTSANSATSKSAGDVQIDIHFRRGNSFPCRRRWLAFRTVEQPQMPMATALCDLLCARSSSSRGETTSSKSRLIRIRSLLLLPAAR